MLSRQAAMQKARKMKEMALKPELREQLHSGWLKSLFLLGQSLFSLSMMRSSQSPSDRILWVLISLNGKSEWCKLRRRTELRAAELNAGLGMLAKDGRISVISQPALGNRAVILLKRPG